MEDTLLCAPTKKKRKRETDLKKKTKKTISDATPTGVEDNIVFIIFSFLNLRQQSSNSKTHLVRMAENIT